MQRLSLTVLAVVFPALALACQKSEPAPDDPGLAAGVGSKSNVVALWKRLATYRTSHLRNWKDALADPDPSARDVLDAFNELGYSVTGPGGFWRKTVHDQWLGCVNEPTSGACKTLAAANDGVLKEWDAFQADIGKVGDGQELAFLLKHHKRMNEYLDTWVPESPNMSAMKETGFYKEKLDKAMGVTATSGDDL